MVDRVCKNKSCGAVFPAKPADVARGWALYCSKSCKAKVQEGKTGANRAYLERQADRDSDDAGHLHASGFFGHGQE